MSESNPKLISSKAEGFAERTLCNVCRGIARYCKLSICPFYKNFLLRFDLSKVESTKSIYGPSPPTILIGERGYPRPSVGQAAALSNGLDISISESPREWLERSLDDLLAARLCLVMGMRRASVSEARQGAELIESLQELAISSRPLDVEMELSGSLVVRPGFSIRSAPHGPSARLEKVKVVGNPSVPRRVDQLISDPYISAREAVKELSCSGIDEYYLSRIFSAGLLGRRLERKLVPTEWSITAVDDILSKHLIAEIKRFNIIDSYRLHTYSAHFNSAYVLLTPTTWMFELLEGWLRYPEVSPYSDHEILEPRKEYAENTGGAYYAVRLSVARHLHSRREQAGAIVFFEVEPGWIPLGVWRFREIVREALQRRGERFQSLDEALGSVAPRLNLPAKRYIARSALVRNIVMQRRLM